MASFIAEATREFMVAGLPTVLELEYENAAVSIMSGVPGGMKGGAIYVTADQLGVEGIEHPMRFMVTIERFD